MTFKQLQTRLCRQLDTADWRQTKDGGWVEKTAYVGPKAKVADSAVISGYARVYGDALVFDNAQVSGNARVYGDARVFGDAQVSGHAQVYGNAWIYKGKLDFGDWSSGDAWAQYQARQNLATELEADLEESTRRLTS